VRLLRRLQRREDGEVARGVDDTKSETHDDGAEREIQSVQDEERRPTEADESSLSDPCRLGRVPLQHAGESKTDDDENPSDELLGNEVSDVCSWRGSSRLTFCKT